MGYTIARRAYQSRAQTSPGEELIPFLDAEGPFAWKVVQGAESLGVLHPDVSKTLENHTFDQVLRPSRLEIDRDIQEAFGPNWQEIVVW